MTLGPDRDGEGNGLTVGGVYGRFAGARELGGSLGLRIGRRTRRLQFGGEDGEEVPRARRWSIGSIDLYALWHRDLSRPTLLLTVSFSLGAGGATSER